MHGSSQFLTIEANKENIPPGMELKEPIVLPEPRVNRFNNSDDTHDNQSSSPVPKPSSAMSQISDFPLSCHDSPVTVNTSADEADDDMETTSRKEKSLGLLCQRFLIAINEETRENNSKEVHLETVARKMNVEKRRIYDIVNVMEAMDAMRKTNKSFYQWQGLERLPKLMLTLQAESIEEGLPERVLRVEQAMCSFTEFSGRHGSKDTVGTLTSSAGADATPSSSVVVKSENGSLAMNDRKSRVDNRDRQGRNSLAQLCRRFLMVLLCNPNDVRKVSLDVASTVLIKDPETEGFEPPSRSRCRRLYDIANVLVALGLIKKVHYLFGTKKIPLFVYCGPEPDQLAKFDVFASVERLLSSQQNTPSTPSIKAQTEKIVQQIAGFGKRALSENNLNENNLEMKTKISKKSERQPLKNIKKEVKNNAEAVACPQASLMMFAELAAAEKYRLDALAQHFSNSMPALFPSTSSSFSLNNSPSSSNSIIPPLPKPQPQKMDINFGFPALNPIYAQNRMIPISPGQQLQNLMLTDQPPVKHSMSTILSSSSAPSTSNKPNVPEPFDHTNDSPFRVVKKSDEARKKKVFGEIQNLQ